MERIYITKRDHIEHGKDCDGLYYISLFFHNRTIKYNGLLFLTYPLYKIALAQLKKHIKEYKDKADDLFLSIEDCRQIEQVFSILKTE